MLFKTTEREHRAFSLYKNVTLFGYLLCKKFQTLTNIFGAVRTSNGTVKDWWICFAMIFPCLLENTHRFLNLFLVDCLPLQIKPWAPNPVERLRT